MSDLDYILILTTLIPAAFFFGMFVGGWRMAGKLHSAGYDIDEMCRRLKAAEDVEE